MVVQLGSVDRIVRADVLKISIWVQKISEHGLEVIVQQRWNDDRERWLPRLACCIATIVVRLLGSDKGHVVEVKGFPWCQELVQSIR